MFFIFYISKENLKIDIRESTKISHFLDEAGQIPDCLPVAAQRKIEYLAQIIEGVTANPGNTRRDG